MRMDDYKINTQKNPEDCYFIKQQNNVKCEPNGRRHGEKNLWYIKMYAFQIYHNIFLPWIFPFLMPLMKTQGLLVLSKER